MSNDYGLMGGRYPAIVRAYDQAKRTCRVEIPGLTDGAEVLPVAEIEYPVGDKARHGSYPTELEILVGDTVWIAFIGGDPRYPIITGYRNPEVGNDVDWRRYHHKNIELIADAILHEIVNTTEITLDPSTIQQNADSQIQLHVGQSTVTLTPAMVELKCGGTTLTVTPGGLAMSGGGSTVSVNGAGVAMNGKAINLN